MEKTFVWIAFTSAWKKHLHVRGENGRGETEIFTTLETSPRAWRKLYRVRRNLQET